jgi:lipopolysaccharide assembly outer membrane protein LptD (OstA)
LLLGATEMRAQSSFGDVPVEITSDHTRMENGLAIADENVIIRHKDTLIYCDYAQYSPDSRDAYLVGNIRIYKEGHLFTADRAIYNLDSKNLQAADFRGDVTPFKFSGDSLSTLNTGSYLVKGGIFTTSDNSKPDWSLHARTVRVYPNDRVIFSNVTIYIGQAPVFWYPYLYQSLNVDQAFTFTPGYYSVWGMFVKTQTTFPLADNIQGKLFLDLYQQRGVGIGFEADWGAKRKSATPFAKLKETAEQKEEKQELHGQNWGRFYSYYIDDAKPETNQTALFREPINPNRYRVSLQDRTFLDEDLYSSININKLSDARFLQDYDISDFQTDPNPDNLIAVTKWSENWSAIIMARKQINQAFDGTDKMPEFALDEKRQQIGDSPFFWDSQNSAGYYERQFSNGSLFPNYQSFRIDSYQQISRPGTYFGWLSIVPHIGARITYYGNSGFTQQDVQDVTESSTTIGPNGVPVVTQTIVPQTTEKLVERGPLLRLAATAGMESSFKFSRAYEEIQSRFLGLDGLRHVVQPFMDFSYVRVSQTPEQIYQFDRFVPSTQAPPIDFPQFNSIDSMDNWAILRLGVRNRFQTRRDSQTTNWLELDTFFDVDFERPDFGNPALISNTGRFSNLYNTLRWSPLPWLGLAVDSQLPVFSPQQGFSQVNTTFTWTVTPNWSISIGDRYINHNPQFTNSNLANIGTYIRLTDSWALGISEQYEFVTGTLETQTYTISRDLSSWIASLGVQVENSGGIKTYGAIVTFTLKDIPGVRLPFTLNPGSLTDLSQNRNK